jgi:hypothetical protein
MIRAVFAQAFDGVPEAEWHEIDMTDIYKASARGLRDLPEARGTAAPGQCVLVHRHAIHGVAPVGRGRRAAPDGRAIVYFRPGIARFEDWLTLP